GVQPAGARVLLPVLHHDGPARDAHGRRAGVVRLAGVGGAEGTVHAGVPPARRADRAVLALRGRGVDLPAADALSDRRRARHGPLSPGQERMAEPGEHVIEPKTYLRIFAALIGLTALTVLFSRVPVSEAWHTLIGLTIAVAKATLVILFFMHLIYSARLTWVVALSGLLWL